VLLSAWCITPGVTACLAYMVIAAMLSPCVIVLCGTKCRLTCDIVSSQLTRTLGDVGMSTHLLCTCRLENATLAVCQSGDLSTLTPDLGGKGTTVSFTNAVIKQLEKKFKGRYD
jgi:hypothetical protein